MHPLLFAVAAHNVFVYFVVAKSTRHTCDGIVCNECCLCLSVVVGDSAWAICWHQSKFNYDEIFDSKLYIFRFISIADCCRYFGKCLVWSWSEVAFYFYFVRIVWYRDRVTCLHGWNHRKSNTWRCCIGCTFGRWICCVQSKRSIDESRLSHLPMSQFRLGDVSENHGWSTGADGSIHIHNARTDQCHTVLAHHIGPVFVWVRRDAMGKSNVDCSSDRLYTDAWYIPHNCTNNRPNLHISTFPTCSFPYFIAVQFGCDV